MKSHTHAIEKSFKSELQRCERNWEECSTKWDNVFNAFESAKMKNELLSFQQCMDAVFKCKSRQIAILSQEFDEANEQRELLFAAKNSAINKLLDIYESRVKFFHNNHIDNVIKIKDKHTSEEHEMRRNFLQPNENLKYLISFGRDEGSNAIKKSCNKRNDAIFALESQNVAEMDKLTKELEENLEWVLIKLQTTLKTYLYEKYYKFLEYEKLNKKDSEAHEVIIGSFQKITNLKSQTFNLKFKTSNENQNLIEELKTEKNNLLQTYVKEQKKMRLILKKDREKLCALSHEAEKSIKTLKCELRKRERVLIIHNLCSSFPSTNVAPTSAEFQNCKNFRIKIKKGERALGVLKKQINDLSNENDSFKNILRKLIKLFSTPQNLAIMAIESLDPQTL